MGLILNYTFLKYYFFEDFQEDFESNIKNIGILSLKCIYNGYSLFLYGLCFRCASMHSK